MSEYPTAEAHIVQNQVYNIQIPAGLNPGDSFLVTPDNVKSFTVIVPEGATPGSYIQLVVPNESPHNVESRSLNSDSKSIKISKSTAGAALAGGILGALMLGPIGAIVIAGGAAIVASNANGKVGETVRGVGDATYSGTSKAKKWFEKQINNNSSRFSRRNDR